MNLADVVQDLYARKINCTVQTQWGAGVVVSIGDTLNGVPAARETFAIHQLALAAEWLDATARELHPKAFT